MWALSLASLSATIDTDIGTRPLPLLIGFDRQHHEPMAAASAKPEKTESEVREELKTCTVLH